MLQAFRRISNLSAFLFCTENKRHALRIARESLSNYKGLQPWKNIRTLYSITLAHQQPSLAHHSEIRQDRILINQVLEQLSSQLHQVPHQQINILMQVLRENGIRYNRDMAIFRALNKQAKMLFGRQLRAELLPKSLYCLKVLDFPKFTINKTLEALVKLAADQNIQKDKKSKMDLSIKLQLTIFSLQQPFVPIPMLNDWLKIVLQQTATSLSALCLLYHLTKVTDICLRRKVQYQYQKTNARELLFNPYVENQQANEQEQSNVSQQKKQFDPKEQFQKIEVKHRLNDLSQEAIKLINESVDVKNLQKTIVKAVQGDSQPFKKQLLLYTCDIPELKPVIQQYVKQKLHQLTPVELIYLLKRCQKDIVDSSIQSYLQHLSQHMSVEQKVYVHVESHKQFHRHVTKEVIFEILDSMPQINYSQFMAIAKLTELLPQSQQKYIGEVLQKIKSKMPPQQQPGSQPKQGL